MNERDPRRSRGFSTLFGRLVSNTEEPANAQGCWSWNKLVVGRYPRLNVRTGDGRHKQIRAHRAMMCILECGEETELFWQLYELYSIAKFEADHLCTGNALCINPDHLRWLTKEEHDAETLRRGQSIIRRYSK